MTILEEQVIGGQQFKYTVNTVTIPFIKNQYSETIDIDHLFCILDIQIKCLTYDSGKQFYDITYNWTYSPWDKNGQNPALMLNPFHNDIQFLTDHSEGEIIYKNLLTDQLVKFLLLPIEELEQICGSVSPYEYQKSLLKMVSCIWD